MATHARLLEHFSSHRRRKIFARVSEPSWKLPRALVNRKWRDTLLYEENLVVGIDNDATNANLSECVGGQCAWHIRRKPSSEQNILRLRMMELEAASRCGAEKSSTCHWNLQPKASFLISHRLVDRGFQLLVKASGTRACRCLWDFHLRAAISVVRDCQQRCRGRTLAHAAGARFCDALGNEIQRSRGERPHVVLSARVIRMKHRAELDGTTDEHHAEAGGHLVADVERGAARASLAHGPHGPDLLPHPP
mmetsp:Transcript_14326/g.32417  ORF Transcript_14326/g.32417 Transcript_14326/m.32417 type:complete len:250 (+) Transcript_14326:561-1310(+)